MILKMATLHLIVGTGSRGCSEEFKSALEVFQLTNQ
jgi:hypothetical protein